MFTCRMDVCRPVSLHPGFLDSGLRVEGGGLRVYMLGFRISGLGFSKSLGFWVLSFGV
jgi:hypothetical protein